MTDETTHIARQAAALDDPSVTRERLNTAMIRMMHQPFLMERTSDDPLYHATHWVMLLCDETDRLRADLARPSLAGDERVARLVEAARDVIEGWEWWTADEYDRDRGVVSDGIHDLTAALSAMNTPAQGGGWQPIETAPKDGTRILSTGGRPDLHYDDFPETAPPPEAVVIWWNDNGQFDPAGWRFCSYDSGYYGDWEDPTHWMPLPAPPAEMKDGG